MAAMVITALIGATSWTVLRRTTSSFADRSTKGAAVGACLSCSLGAVIGWRFGFSLLGTTVVVMTVGLTVLSEIDHRSRRLPREISYPLFGLGLVFAAGVAIGEGTTTRFVDAVVGAGFATIVLGALHLASRGGLGDGDVRLAPALGVLGVVGGVPGVWAGLLIAFVSAGAVALVLWAVGRTLRTTTIPFGPFLAAGAVASAIIGGGGS